MRVVALCAVLCACSFDVPRSMRVSSYREEYHPQAQGCITVWDELGVCQFVSTEGGEPSDCASGPDVLVIRDYPGQQCSLASHNECDCSIRPRVVDGKVVW